MIKIEMLGSFPKDEKVFKAQTHGHAHAVNAAIKWLSNRMKESINLDHQLSAEGVKPDEGFTKL